jgi:hypothetical protein
MTFIVGEYVQIKKREQTMRYGTVLALMTLGIGPLLFAQQGNGIRPSSVQIHSAERGLPCATLEYDREAIGKGLDASLLRESSTPVSFTAFAVGWNPDGLPTEAAPMILRVRTRTLTGQWTEWRDLATASEPSETPSGLFWSELATTPDGTAHSGFEIEFPETVRRAASAIKVIVVDATDSHRSLTPEELFPKGQPLDLHPPIVPRSQWWGDLPPAYLNPTNYTPEYISISHTVVHHTAGTNNPPDPAQDIRGIWYYHVFGQGWSDIAYNFLIDQYGTIYQGRYNPYIDLLDVRGSHATYANNQSVGISLLGTFSVDTPPTAAAVQSLTRTIAWRFQQRNLDPLSRADMVMDQAGNKVNLYRVSGHRDISATACPGDALYAQLPSIRTTADMLIQADDSTTLPQSFSLAQNYPNPFNPATTIEYSVPVAGQVRLIIYDVLGREVVRLVDDWQSEGPHTAVFDAALQPSGAYFYTLIQSSNVSSRRMMLIR